MSRGAWTPGTAPSIGIATECDDVDLEPADLEPALAGRDASVVSGTLSTVLAATPSVVVADGESNLSAVTRADPGAPVLPVGDVPGIPSVDSEDVTRALEMILEGEAIVRTHPVLGVETPGGNDERALFDVSLVTAEPAQISEYGVSSRDESIAQFRADGVVAATPAGSHGYASTVDGPLLSPSLDGVAVVPIAPFKTQIHRWVLPADDLVLSVERDADPVVVCVDDRIVERVPAGDHVSITPNGSLSTFAVPGED
ncbi:NAD(+)/NADH kinase [Natrarchaeobius chitinivorans]|uniref:NAD(+)/NADH kinase n=1 Tax=Natrarchaeobius chitinivorans TaxID=1679083 RepID=A0A3N6M1I7_NATCH|nr:NAD(+)/NADH kinase [Natrarchaeobius chitinivorans]RQG97193.1 NAD(+)/NADH kinase [Natrarchaeobius chitinivorans]